MSEVADLPWLRDLLLHVAGATPSLLDVGSGVGRRLAQAAAAGVEPFGVDPSGTAEGCRSAYVVDRLADLPPHRFDVILLSGGIGGLSPREILYALAAKDAFGAATWLVALDQPGHSLDRIADDLRDLRFREVALKEDATGRRLEAHGSDFARFMQERYVPGTWSELAAYEHLPRYAFASDRADGARVLDFGCGSGYGTAVLARTARHVTGLDSDDGALAFARAHHAAPNLDFVQDAAFGASLGAGSFDLVVCFEVIEHLDGAAQGALLQGLRRMLAPGGTLIISTPNPAVTAFYGANPFHLHEVTKPQFCALLADQFPHVALLEQSIEVGVFLRPGGASGLLQPHRGLVEFDGDAPPAIFLAVCSDHPVEPLPATVYLDKRRSFVQLRVEAMAFENESLLLRYHRAKLEAAAEHREEARVAAEYAATAAKDEVQRVAAELAANQAEASAVLEDRALLQRTYEGARMEAASYSAALTDLQAGQQAAEAEHARVQEVADRLKEELQAGRSELAAVRRSAEADRAAADRSANELRATDRLMHSELGRLNRLRRAEQQRTRAEWATLHAETSRLQAQATRLTGELAGATALAASRQQQIASLDGQLQFAQEHLAVIEASTTWRAIRRAAPFLTAVKPVIRPLLRAGSRTMHALIRQDAAPPTTSPRLVLDAETAVTRPAEPAAAIRPSSLAEPAERQVPTPAPVDPRVARETALDPVWNDGRGEFTLAPDPGFTVQTAPSGQLLPYVVVPLTPIDPDAVRPTILHVIPNVHIGGSTQLVIDLVQHLSSTYRHEVLTSSLWPGGDHDGLVVHLVATPSVAEMAVLVTRIDPDLVHFHYWGLTDDPWYFAAVDAIAGHGVPAIQNINTPIAPLRHDMFSHYVFVSEYVRQTYGGAVVGQCPTSVIYPGVDLGRFSGDLPAAGRDDAVGMVYRLEDDKLNADAIDVFIEIAKRRPRTKIYIIGGGRFLIPYVERTAAAGVRQNFRFTGYVPYESLPAWYDRFAVFVAPVWKESFGQVAPFAMCKRGAVAGFAVGALPEILGSVETLGETSATVADIVVKLLEDKPRLNALGEHNRQRALSLFDVNQMVASYAALYDSLQVPLAEPT